MPELAIPKNTVIQNALHLCGVNLAPLLRRLATISRISRNDVALQVHCCHAREAGALCCLNDGMKEGAAGQPTPNETNPPQPRKEFWCPSYHPLTPA